MLLRSDFEKKEKDRLSKYAALSYSAKRQHLEEKDKYRTSFQRDRDRIIHSKAFRRLKHKTQVFISPTGDHYRTRLTHTLEVSQIARSICRSLNLNEDLVEAISLAHDIGHTPFGHTGERVLNTISKNGFKHNVHGLRIVEFLENKISKPYKGLNLTDLVRDGILNHSGNLKPATLEGYIVKFSDRIAYVNHDIDDALRAGILKEEDLPTESIKVLGDTHSKRINYLINDIVLNSFDKPKISFSDRTKEAFEILRTFLFKYLYTDSTAKKEEIKVEKMLKLLYNYYLGDKDDDTEVLDYIAGMTDKYAVTKFKEIFVPDDWR